MYINDFCSKKGVKNENRKNKSGSTAVFCGTVNVAFRAVCAEEGKSGNISFYRKY
jgi:hypothetical protein